MYQQQKRYNTAVIQRLQTWHGDVNENRKMACVAPLGRPQVAMHSQLLRFLVYLYNQLVHEVHIITTKNKEKETNYMVYSQLSNRL